MSDELQAAWNRVQERVAAAAGRAGRSAEDVTVMAVTKTQPAEVVREALALGLMHIGENKVQEAAAKREAVGRGLWHLIGHLQSNKAKVAVEIFDRVDSVDSLDIGRELSKRAAAIGKTLPVLMEVNVAGEASKFGVAPGEASRVAEQLNALPALELRGLMTLAPFCVDPEKARPALAGLREIRDRVERETGLRLPELSMGMSHDFDVAIEEGSTQVRLGTILFGERRARAKINGTDSDL
jgi:pyridoxal phosphate enzyme (YggS family)